MMTTGEPALHQIWLWFRIGSCWFTCIRTYLLAFVKTVISEIFIPTVVRMKIKVLRDLTSCSLVIEYTVFFETLGLFYQNTHHHTTDNHMTVLHRRGARSVKYSLAYSMHISFSRNTKLPCQLVP
jgi:hypothetical protein